MKVKVKNIASFGKNHKINIDASKVIDPELIKKIQNLSLDDEVEIPSLEQQKMAISKSTDRRA